MARVNPPVHPGARAREAEAEIRANGGWLTAEEWERTRTWERYGWSPSKPSALRMAGPDGAIFGKPGSWDICRLTEYGRCVQLLEDARCTCGRRLGMYWEGDLSVQCPRCGDEWDANHFAVRTERYLDAEGVEQTDIAGLIPEAVAR